MTNCAFVEWPEGLEPAGERWDALRREVDAARADILITNEMPFGAWLASADRFDAAAADRSVALHERGLQALSTLEVGAVISSWPVRLGDKLANEAYALENGTMRPLHRKQLFPQEPGWHEASWFQGDGGGFAVHDVAGVKVGILLCTELMFNEHARRYGRAGAELIAVPRATGQSRDKWVAAGAMAAIVSGSYVVSANRVGHSAGSPIFGGGGLAFGPDGDLLAGTSAEAPLVVVPLDVERSRRQKSEYPCYVSDIAG